MTVIIPVGSTYIIRDSANTVDDSVLTDAGDLTIRTSVTSPALRATGSPWFDVTAYGAGGGGPDQAFIGAAVGDALAAGGGTVFFPAGTYNLTDFVGVSSLTNVTFAGVGDASRILQNVSTKRIFSGGSSNGIFFQDLYLGGDPTIAIALSTSSGIRVSRCTITGATMGDGMGILLNAVDDVLLENNTISGCGTGGSTPAGADICLDADDGPSTNVRIVGNQCVSTGVRYNISCFDCADLTIEGNTCSGASGDTVANSNGGYGILVYNKMHSPTEFDCHDIVIANNRVKDTQGTGVYVQSCQRVAISGNEIHDVASTQSDSVLAVGCISCSESSEVSITGNTLIGSGKAGIVFSTSSDAETTAIAGNTISGADGIGIQLRGSVTRISIAGNTVTDCGGGIGSSGSDAVSGVTIIGNHISNITGTFSGIEAQNYSQSSVMSNVIATIGRYGIAIGGSRNVVSGNTVVDASQSSSLAFDGIYVSASECVVEGNQSGNSSGIANEQNYGLRISGSNCLVVNNVARHNHVASGLVLSAGTVSAGNIGDPTTVYEIPTSMALTGTPSSVIQLAVGSSGTISSFGARYSGGDAVWAMNARQTVGSDLWTQSDSGHPSWLALMDVTGGMKFFNAVAGRTAGTYSAFWGSPVVSFRADGAITSSGGSDADSTIFVGTGGSSPTVSRNTILALNAPNSGTHFGQAFVSCYRNSALIVSAGLFANTTGAMTSNGDYAWSFGGAVAVAALTSSGELRTAGGLQSASDVDAAGGYRRLHNGWSQAGTVAASQTDVALADSVSPRGRLMTRAGSVTAIALNISTARTAGTLTVRVQKSTDGGGTWATISASCAATLSTSVHGAQATFAKDTYSFSPGDLLRAVVTTDGSWAPTANNLDVAIEVEG